MSGQRCIVGGYSNRTSNETRFRPEESSFASPVVGFCSEKHVNAMEWADPSLL